MLCGVSDYCGLVAWMGHVREACASAPQCLGPARSCQLGERLRPLGASFTCRGVDADSCLFIGACICGLDFFTTRGPKAGKVFFSCSELRFQSQHFISFWLCIYEWFILSSCTVYNFCVMLLVYKYVRNLFRFKKVGELGCFLMEGWEAKIYPWCFFSPYFY